MSNWYKIKYFYLGLAERFCFVSHAVNPEKAIAEWRETVGDGAMSDIELLERGEPAGEFSEASKMSPADTEHYQGLSKFLGKG